MAERFEGYDDEFDYAGKDMVAPWYRLRGMGGKRARDYVGTPVGSSSAGAVAGAVVQGLEQRFGKNTRMSQALRVWRKMGDPRARAHVQGLYLRQNRASRELIAYVDASVWMHEFSMLAPMYLQEWNHLCQSYGLDMQAGKLTFRLSTRARSTGQTGTLGSSLGGVCAAGPSRVPLDAAEMERIRRTTAVITDERLRNRVSEAMKGVMEWQKAQNGHKDRNGA